MTYLKNSTLTGSKSMPSKLLVHGDSRKILVDLKTQIHAVVTDPPADISFLTKDTWGIGDRHDLLTEVLELSARLAVPGAYALVWSLPKEQHLTAHCLEEAGWTIKDIITHHFGTGQPKSSGLKPATEFWTLGQYKTGRKLNIDECMILDPTNLPMKWSRPRGGFWQTQIQEGEDTPKLIENVKGRYPSNVVVDEFIADYLPRFFYVRKVLGKARTTHPTEKSLELMRYLIRLISHQDETVLDPFMGSGSTGVAAIQENRNFVGIEENEDYHKIAVGRMGTTDQV